ncbi:MAG: hypothetical protein IJC16_08425 [Rikenellaceae bacterium]|nr:hypothetical protein [Rikenellaceae bacterium]
MKRTILLCCLLALSFAAQAQILRAPSEGRSMVYFYREPGTAFLIKIDLYDSTRLLGTLGQGRFMAYECAPGRHIFAASSENFDIAEATLEAGRTYMIEVQPVMGIAVARVSLKPVDRTARAFKRQAKEIRAVFERNKELRVAPPVDPEQVNHAGAAPDTPDIMKKHARKKETGNIVVIPDSLWITSGDLLPLRLRPAD